MKRVFIIHGYTGHPGKNWFPWLKAQLEPLGVEAAVPAMPHADAPQLEEWLAELEEVVGPVDADTFFVGHSLGCSAILRFLERQPAGTQAGGAVLVAAFAEPIHFTELDHFTVHDWDDKRIRQAVAKLVAINSDNDEHVPLVMGEHIRDRFGAELVVLHGAGHINEKSGFVTAPVILDQLKKVMEIA